MSKFFNMGSKKNKKNCKQKSLLYRHHCSKHGIHVQCKMNQIPFQIFYFLPDLRDQLIFSAEKLFGHQSQSYTRGHSHNQILPAYSKYSVCEIILYPPSFLLEIRVIIKILKNPWYPINWD